MGMAIPVMPPLLVVVRKPGRDKPLKSNGKNSEQRWLVSIVVNASVDPATNQTFSNSTFQSDSKGIQTVVTERRAPGQQIGSSEVTVRK